MSEDHINKAKFNINDEANFRLLLMKMLPQILRKQQETVAFPVKCDSDKLWHEVTVESGSLVDYADGRKCTDTGSPCILVPINGIAPHNGDFGVMFEIEDLNDYMYLYAPCGGSGGFIPVSLTQDSGTNGSQTTAPNYTYKNPVNLLTGQEIMNGSSHYTGLSPQWAREIGEFNVAAYGTGYYNSSGTFVLFQVNETEQVCT